MSFNAPTTPISTGTFSPLTPTTPPDSSQQPLDAWIRSILPTLALDSSGNVTEESQLAGLIAASVPNNLGYRRGTVRDRVWELLNTGLLERISKTVSAGQWRDRAHVEGAVAEIVSATPFLEHQQLHVKIPVYPEITLPYSLQHALLSPLFAALERLCWTWTRNNTALFELHRDCPEAAELTTWITSLTPMLPALTAHAPALGALRNAVVHRTPVYATTLTQILRATESTSRILGDPALAARIAGLSQTVSRAVREVSSVRISARERVRVQMERIEAEIARLNMCERGEVAEGEKKVLRDLRRSVEGWWKPPREYQGDERMGGEDNEGAMEGAESDDSDLVFHDLECR
ncbi:hypothetical protein EDC01DRAFT_482160 [Geopyxis carbonaria]|nr:hypothetical protein EDC01DRAFT_482160 [Geopyxis carbonaria]